jgi:hypothetical protein
MGAGAAILIAPQLAGTIADQIGITSALSITAVLIALALIIVVIANRQSRF